MQYLVQESQLQQKADQLKVTVAPKEVTLA